VSRIQVNTDLVHAQAKQVAYGQNRIGGAWRALAEGLSGTEGMAGNPGKDEAAAEFLSVYAPAAETAWKAFAALHRSVGDMSKGLTQTANNHLKAENGSVVPPKRFSMFPQQQGLLTDKLLGFTVSGPLNVPGPPSAAGPGEEAPKSLLESLTGIEIGLFDVSEYWPTGNPMKLYKASQAWQAAHDALVGARGPIATATKTVTDHSDAPDIDAFGAYWRKVYADCAPGTLFDGLPRLCAALARACNEYGQAISSATVQMNSAVGNPIAVVIQAAAIRAAMAAAARALLQTVGTITAGALGYQLVSAVSAAVATAPTVTITETVVEGRRQVDLALSKQRSRDKPETLTQEEQAAVDAKAAGLPYDQKAYRRAMQKIKKNEKLAGDRNKEKRGRKK